MDPITRDCPIACLAPLLSPSTFAALATGLDGSPATVGQVVELYEQGSLLKLRNIGTGRRGEVRRCLATAGLIATTAEPLGMRQGKRETGERYAHHDACPLH